MIALGIIQDVAPLTLAVAYQLRSGREPAVLHFERRYEIHNRSLADD